MPYDIKQDDSRCPAGKSWSVVSSDTNKLHGCHPTKESARQQQKALYANVPDADQDRADDSCCGNVTYTTPTTQAW